MSGGGSSSSSQATNQTDNRRVIGQSGVSAENSTVNYTMTDDGAIAGALALAASTVQANSAATKATQTQALDSLNQTTSAVQAAYASSRGAGAMTEYVLIGALALSGIIAYAAISKK